MEAAEFIGSTRRDSGSELKRALQFRLRKRSIFTQQRDDARRYRHYLKGNALLRSVHSVAADDIEFIWNIPLSPASPAATPNKSTIRVKAIPPLMAA